MFVSDSSIDKLLHSLGYEMGYALKKSMLLNPLDYVFVQSQKVCINRVYLYFIKDIIIILIVFKLLKLNKTVL